MTQYLIKVLVSAIIIVAVTEVSKRGGTFWGGILASLPLTSLLAFIWLYADTRSASQVSALSSAIFWLVLPSLTLFIALPVLLNRGVAFPLALGIALIVMVAAYIVTTTLVSRLGIKI